jgi:hypothetical protein
VPKLVGARRASVIWPQSRGAEISAPMESRAGVGTRPERALLEFASRQPAIISVCNQNRYMYQNKYIYWSSTGCQQISATPAFAFCVTQNQFLNQGEGPGAGVSVDRDGKPRKFLRSEVAPSGWRHSILYQKRRFSLLWTRLPRIERQRVLRTDRGFGLLAATGSFARQLCPASRCHDHPVGATKALNHGPSSSQTHVNRPHSA